MNKKQNKNLRLPIFVISLCIIFLALVVSLVCVNQRLVKTQNQYKIVLQQKESLQTQLVDSQNKVAQSQWEVLNTKASEQFHFPSVDTPNGNLSLYNPQKADMILEGKEKTVTLFENIWTGMGNGSFGFAKTSNVNIFRLQLTDGDMCFGVNHNYYIDTKKQSAIAVKVDQGCGVPQTLTVIDSTKKESKISFSLENDTCQSVKDGVVSCKTEGAAQFVGFLVNGVPNFALSQKRSVPCGGDSGIDTICDVGYPTIDVLGVNPTMTVVYFSVDKQKYSFELETQKITEAKSISVLKVQEQKN